MNKQVPSLGRILVMVGFALSCFGLLLFLWLAFGGATPLKPKGYRFHVSFSEATQLASEADVRISGVTVGKVKKIETSKASGRSVATVQLDSRYAPLPRDSRATLRQKTLLGETYVELTPGTPKSPTVPDGGTLSRANVSDTVELDEILRTFDPKTRQAFENWIQQQAISLDGRARDLSDALGNLAPFAENTEQVVKLLNSQKAAVRQLVRNTGTVFDALSERDGQLSSLVTSSNRVFATTARRNQELAAAFKALPTFERESSTTLRRLTKFANTTDPLVKELQPAAEQLSPTLVSLAKTAPDLKQLMQAIDPLVKASDRGLPATQKFLEGLKPLLAELNGPLANLNPILDGANLYRSDITALLGNATAATNYNTSINGEQPFSRVLRTAPPLFPESISTYRNRLPTNRANAYALPGAGSALPTGLAEFLVSPGCQTSFTFNVPDPDPSVMTKTLRDTIVKIALSGGTVNAPPCNQQPRYDLAGTLTRFPQVKANVSGLQAGLPQP